jgi:hypothetical protein
MRIRYSITLFALGMASLVTADPRVAQGKADPPGQGVLAKTFAVAPKGLKWGMSLEAVAKLYDKVLEEDYLPLMKKTEPGPDMTALEEELKNRQGILRRGRIEFGNVPTGVDQSPLKGEYSYGNNESMATLRLRNGTERHFFFFNDRLWKVYDEHKLAKGKPLGESFEEAVKALTKRFGAPGKAMPANSDKGQAFDEVVWRDPENVMRAIDRGNVLGMVYIDKGIQDSLAEHRKNKAADLHEMDRDVAAATQKGPEAPPSGPKDKDKKGKDAKGK